MLSALLWNNAKLVATKQVNRRCYQVSVKHNNLIENFLNDEGKWSTIRVKLILTIPENATNDINQRSAIRFTVSSLATPNSIYAFNYTYCRDSMHLRKIFGVPFYLIWTANFKLCKWIETIWQNSTIWKLFRTKRLALSGKYLNAFFLYRKCSPWDWLRNQHRIIQCIATWKITSKNMCNSFSIWSVQLIYWLFESFFCSKKWRKRFLVRRHFLFIQILCGYAHEVRKECYELVFARHFNLQHQNPEY